MWPSGSGIMCSLVGKEEVDSISVLASSSSRGDWGHKLEPILPLVLQRLQKEVRRMDGVTVVRGSMCPQLQPIFMEDRQTDRCTSIHMPV